MCIPILCCGLSVLGKVYYYVLSYCHREINNIYVPGHSHLPAGTTIKTLDSWLSTSHYNRMTVISLIPIITNRCCMHPSYTASAA